MAKALRSGFRGIDTAAQPKHYYEAGVGAALREVVAEVPRESVFVQTKFTPPAGHDLAKPIPYNLSASVDQQVRESFASSLLNLGVEQVDSLLLHSPLATPEDTVLAWRAFEALHADGSARMLGICNVDLAQLENLYRAANVKPAVVQNRFYGRTSHDRLLREYAHSRGIVYQSFWTLTGNRQTVASPEASHTVV